MGLEKDIGSNFYFVLCCCCCCCCCCLLLLLLFVVFLCWLLLALLSKRASQVPPASELPSGPQPIGLAPAIQVLTSSDMRPLIINFLGSNKQGALPWIRLLFCGRSTPWGGEIATCYFLRTLHTEFWKVFLRSAEFEMESCLESANWTRNLLP